MAKSLRKGLGIHLVNLILIPVILFSVISILTLYSIVSGQLDRNQEALFELMEDRIRDSIEFPIQEMYKSIDVHHRLLTAGSSFNEYLQILVDNYPLFLTIYVLDQNGMVIHCPRGQDAVLGNDYSNFPFYHDFNTEDSMYWSSTFMSTEFSEITFAFALRSDRGDLYVGLYSLDSLQNLIASLNVGEGETISVINQSRFYLAHSQKERVEQRMQENQLNLEKPFQIIKEQGRWKMVKLRLLDDLGLFLVRSLDFRQYYQSLISVILSYLIMILFIILVVFFYSRTQSRRISNHIQQLITSSEKIAEGKYDQIIKNSYYSELNHLAQNYNRMASQIQHALAEKQEQIIKVKENEAQLQLLMDFSYDGIIFISPEKKILRVSNSAKGLFNLDENSLSYIESCCYQILFKKSESCESCLLEMCLAKKETQFQTIEVYDRVFEETAVPVFGEDSLFKGIIMTYRDVTEKLELERKLTKAAKMEALGRFAGGIAHDFNNILQVIFGYTELLSSPNSEEHKQEYLNSILETAEKAEVLVQQLMAFCRLEEKAKAPLELDVLIHDSVGLLNRLLNDNYQLLTDLNCTERTILAEKSKIEQIVMNLVVNARDAMPNQGTITIRTGQAVRNETDYLFIEVIDQGMGIAKEVKDKIFEPFFTTKELGKGTGLGLATVFGIVESHHGILEVDSEESKGSTFRVLFPENFPGV